MNEWPNPAVRTRAWPATSLATSSTVVAAASVCGWHATVPSQLIHVPFPPLMLVTAAAPRPPPSWPPAAAVWAAAATSAQTTPSAQGRRGAGHGGGSAGLCLAPYDARIPRPKNIPAQSRRPSPDSGGSRPGPHRRACLSLPVSPTADGGSIECSEVAKTINRRSRRHDRESESVRRSKIL